MRRVQDIPAQQHNNTKNILALDAAFGSACACLIRGDGTLFHAVSPSDKPHSQTILPILEKLLVDAALNWPDLQLLAIGTGPGSFTGLRVAIATMTGINAGLRLPILELSSLAITAQQSRVCEPLWVIEDACAGNAWIGQYRQGMPLGQDVSQSWDQVCHKSANIYLTHTPDTVDLPGWKHLPLEIPRCEALAMLSCQYIHMADMHTAKQSHPVTPVYLSPSQAERNACKI